VVDGYRFRDKQLIGVTDIIRGAIRAILFGVKQDIGGQQATMLVSSELVRQPAYPIFRTGFTQHARMRAVPCTTRKIEFVLKLTQAQGIVSTT
jgi:hypothetical protein